MPRYSADKPGRNLLNPIDGMLERHGARLSEVEVYASQHVKRPDFVLV